MFRYQTTNGGIGRALFRRAFANEPVFINEIAGTGTIILEPTWGHYVLLEMDDDDFILDDGMFNAGIGDIDVSTARNGIIAGATGGESFVQTRIKGTGIAVLNSPVPFDEIVLHELSNGKLSVDGPFAVIRDASVTFKVEKSAKSWISTAVSGEGLLQTFTGEGRVWVAPTLAIYQALKRQSLSQFGTIRTDQTG